MRVLHVTNMYPEPGSSYPYRGIFVQRLEQALQHAGVQSELVEINGRAGPHEYLLARRRVRALAGRFKPDVVHAHYGYSVLSVPARWPRVVTFHGDDLNGESRADGSVTMKSRLGIQISRWAAHVCDRSIAVSAALKERIRNPEDRRRCAVIRDAVDTKLFFPAGRSAARRRLGLDDDGRLRILFPHKVTEANKRVELAVAAVSALVMRGTPAELWIVNGRTPDEMPDYYRASDAMIVTSSREGGPMSAKEAIACGLPVVSVPVGDMAALAAQTPLVALCAAEPEALATGLETALMRREETVVPPLPNDLRLDTAAARLMVVYREAIEGFARSRPFAPADQLRSA